MTLFANVNVGTAPNDGTGDSLRQSFRILNNNFNYINQTIWPDISIRELQANVTSSYISRFNLLQAAAIQGSIIGNPGAEISGNTISSNSFQGNIGTYGANAAIFSTLTSDSAIISNLVVSGNTILSNLIITSINDVPIGVNGAAQAKFTDMTVFGNIESFGNYDSIGNISGFVANTTWTLRSVFNAINDANLSASTNVALTTSNVSKQYVATRMNTNVTISYVSVNQGVERIWVIRNHPDNTARQIVLPTRYNNKGSTTVSVGANANVMLHFISFGTDSANVYVNITNS